MKPGQLNQAMMTFAGVLLALGVASAPAQVVVRGKTVYTMAGPPIENGVVVVTDGQITAVGKQGEIAEPPGHQVLEAEIVTPGLIDAHTTVGLSGQFNYDHDQDQLEHSSPIQPQLRALDAYNPRERLVEWVRGFGVTTIHTGHAPGEVISGQTMIIKTVGEDVDSAVLVKRAAIAATLGESALKSRKQDKSPGTRSKMIALLRGKLVAARHYQQKRQDDDVEKRPDVDLEMETLAELLDRRTPLLITAHRAQDIANALRLAEEFNLRLILDGAAEAYLLIDRIKETKTPVILHPTMMRAFKETENMSFETAAKLVEAGVLVALQSGYESYVPKTRVVLYEAAWAAANGLTFEQALATITLNAAKIIGVDERVGSLEVGKDGDAALYDGDPFEYTTHCIGVVVDGQVVSTQTR